MTIFMIDDVVCQVCVKGLHVLPNRYDSDENCDTVYFVLTKHVATCRLYWANIA